MDLQYTQEYNQNFEDFLQACLLGQVNIVRKLLHQYPQIKNQQINCYQHLIFACKKGYLEIVQILVQTFPLLKQYLSLAFRIACFNDKLDIADFITSYDPESIQCEKNNYILQYACLKENFILVNFLINLKKNFNIKYYPMIHYMTDDIEKIKQFLEINKFIFKFEINIQKDYSHMYINFSNDE